MKFFVKDFVNKCDQIRRKLVNMYSSYKTVWRIPIFIVTAYKKKYCSELILLQSCYYLEWNVIAEGCLFDYWHILTYIINLLPQCVNELI